MSTMIAEVYDALKEAGVSEEKARAASTAIADKEALATKEDLLRFQSDLKQEIHGVQSDLKQEIHGVQSDLKQEIHGVQSELRQEINDIKAEIRVLKWMLGVLIAGIASLILKAFFM